MSMMPRCRHSLPIFNKKEQFRKPMHGESDRNELEEIREEDLDNPHPIVSLFQRNKCSTEGRHFFI